MLHVKRIEIETWQNLLEFLRHSICLHFHLFSKGILQSTKNRENSFISEVPQDCLISHNLLPICFSSSMHGKHGYILQSSCQF